MKVSKIKKDKKFYKIYDIDERVMIERKNIYPNLDSHTDHMQVTIYLEPNSFHIADAGEDQTDLEIVHNGDDAANN